MTALDWQQQAACRGADPALFDADDLHGKAVEKHADRVARMFCNDCPVREQCLEYALGNDAGRFGIWGGLAAHQRDALTHPGRRSQRR